MPNLDAVIAALSSVLDESGQSRRAAEAELLAMMRREPAETLAVLADCADSQRLEAAGRQAAAVLTNRMVMDEWRTACERLEPSSRNAVAMTLLTSCQAADAPRGIAVQLERACGALAANEYAAGCLSDDFLHALQAPLQNSAAAPWLRLRTLAVLHHFLRTAAGRPLHLAAFAPLFKHFGPAAAAVMQSSLSAAAADEMALRTFVLASKCVLRCAATANFDGQIVAFALAATHDCMVSFPASDASHAAIQVLQRLGKIVTKAVEQHASELHHIGASVVQNALLPVLCNATMPPAGRYPAKFVSRCLVALQTLLTLTPCDELLGHVVPAFFSVDGIVANLLTNLVHGFLADAEVCEQDWAEEPEKCVVAAEMDPDADDEGHCAEQVLLAMLDVGGDGVKSAAWDLLTGIIAGGGDEGVIGALHALGVAYEPFGEVKSEDFAQFVGSTLLPVIRGERGAVSPKLGRRAVWVIGMWCFAVRTPSDRAVVQSALATLIVQTADPVIVLTAIRSMENYVTDDQFTVEELPSNLQGVLARVGEVVPRLRDPDAVKLVTNFLSILMAKTNASIISFDAVIALLAPVLGRYLQATVDEDDRSVAACVGELMRVLAEAARGCADSAAAWQHLCEPAIFCTDSENTASLMADTEAWDVLFALVRSTSVEALRDEATATLFDRAFEVAVRSADRDFEAQAVAMRMLGAALLVLRDAGTLRPDHVERACAAVAHLLPDVTDADVVTALQCAADAALLVAPDAASPLLLPVAFRTAAHFADPSYANPSGFNAAAAIVGRAASTRVDAVASFGADALAHFVDAALEAHDEMTDAYQCRIIVNGVIAIARALGSADSLSHASTMRETEELKEQWRTVPEQLGDMWGEDGQPSRHAERLSRLAEHDNGGATLWTIR